MERRFTYRRDRRTRRLTWIISAVLACAFAALWLLLGGGYLRAWTIAMLLAIVLLYVLSIPRYIKVTGDALEIHCVVEMTRIALGDIRSARRITRGSISPLVVLLGSWGFFGYYGYFANLRRWETVKVYASEWDNLVEIEDIYESRYVVSCRDADELLKLLNK